MKEIIVNHFVNCNYISEEDRDIYYYGLYVIQLNVITDLIVLILSLWLNQFSFGIIFLLSFNCIRIYWGGLHANHPFSCFISFMMIFIFNVFVFSKYNISNIVLYYIMLIIIYLTPSMQTKDKETIKRNDLIKKKVCILFCFIPFIVDNRIIQIIFQSLLTNTILHYLERIKRTLIRNKT